MGHVIGLLVMVLVGWVAGMETSLLTHLALGWIGATVVMWFRDYIRRNGE